MLSCKFYNVFSTPSVCASPKLRGRGVSCKAKPQIKICGLTSAKDASVAAEAGADFTGMILWPKARRFVDIATAREIVSISKYNDSIPVGVFVDENALDIARICDITGLDTVQLHGEVSRKSIDSIPSWIKVIYVHNAKENGQFSDFNSVKSFTYRTPDWHLLDSFKGGSGLCVDWKFLATTFPLNFFAKEWILAGGLMPENIEAAISTLNPAAVDVSSGVCYKDGIRKDPQKIKLFIKKAKGFSY